MDPNMIPRLQKATRFSLSLSLTLTLVVHLRHHVPMVPTWMATPTVLLPGASFDIARAPHTPRDTRFSHPMEIMVSL